MQNPLSKPDLASAVQKIAQRYFQLEVIGGEKIPRFADQNCLLVMNHTVFFELEVYLFGSFLLDQPSPHANALDQQSVLASGPFPDQTRQVPAAGGRLLLRAQAG